jgi:hypothetical protein
MRKLGTFVVVLALIAVVSQTSRGDRRPNKLKWDDPIDLPLSAEDSITIDGTRYTCGASGRSGVKMSGGDVVTAGRFKLRCVARPGDLPPPPPSPAQMIHVRSAVDATCIQAFAGAITGYFKGNEASNIAQACRPLAVDASCVDMTTKHDATCFAALQKGMFSYPTDVESAAMMKSCSAVEADCPADGKTATSRVDLKCLDQLYKSARTYPKAPALIGWIDQCRESPRQRCTAVSASFDGACFKSATKMLSTYPTPGEATELVTRCRSIDYRCPGVVGRRIDL